VNLETIAPARLKELLDGPRPPVVMDVRLEDDFNGCRPAGAVNNCVFEVAFTGRLAALAPDRSRPVCLVGAAAPSREMRMAAEKLARLGYATVYQLDGGIGAWCRAGFPVVGAPAEAPVVVPRDGMHPIDLQESRIQWTGRNLLNHHTGRIALKSGELRVKDGQLVGGAFLIDMTAITCSDLAGEAMHDVLVRHLLDHDFFDAAVFPEASYRIVASEPVPGGSPGAPNLRVKGELTLKGVTAELDLVACSGRTADGKLAAQATLVFDRTRWNVFYGSGKWFHRLGGHLVNDLIELQLRIVTA
jgi:rhodanese-related sulfurtransferase/polyisoprenoid-binding protein YceI